MRLWTVHEPRAAANAAAWADRTLFIKDGFSWPAFLIPLPWLLYHRLWLGTLIYVLIAVAAGLAGTFLPLTENAGFALALLANLYAGFEGSDLRRRKIEARGFVQTGSVLAKKGEEAELVYFAERAAIPATFTAPPQDAPHRVHTPSGGHGVLGLFPEPGGQH